MPSITAATTDAPSGAPDVGATTYPLAPSPVGIYNAVLSDRYLESNTSLNVPPETKDVLFSLTTGAV